MNNRSRWGEGLWLWGLIIATPFVLLFGSAAAVASLSFYWSCILMAALVSGVLWSAILITGWRKRRRNSSQNRSDD